MRMIPSGPVTIVLTLPLSQLRHFGQAGRLRVSIVSKWEFGQIWRLVNRFAPFLPLSKKQDTNSKNASRLDPKCLMNLFNHSKHHWGNTLKKKDGTLPEPRAKWSQVFKVDILKLSWRSFGSVCPIIVALLVRHSVAWQLAWPPTDWIHWSSKPPSLHVESQTTQPRKN